MKTPRFCAARAGAPAMIPLETLLSWAQSLGIGGAFFVLALSTAGVCALALIVVLTALKRGKS